jgi:Tfp pilus assembly protein PilX
VHSPIDEFVPTPACAATSVAAATSMSASPEENGVVSVLMVRWKQRCEMNQNEVYGSAMGVCGGTVTTSPNN